MFCSIFGVTITRSLTSQAEQTPFTASLIIIIIIIIIIIKVFIQGFKQTLKLTSSIINEDTTV